MDLAHPAARTHTVSLAALAEEICWQRRLHAISASQYISISASHPAGPNFSLFPRRKLLRECVCVCEGGLNK